MKTPLHRTALWNGLMEPSLWVAKLQSKRPRSRHGPAREAVVAVAVVGAVSEVVEEEVEEVVVAVGLIEVKVTGIAQGKDNLNAATSFHLYSSSFSTKPSHLSL